MAEYCWRTGERNAHMTRPPEPTRRLLSPTSEAERARVGKRLLWALPVALVLIVVLALLGPGAETIERKFTPYGDAGPLRLMPEISIDDGEADRHQRASAEAARRRQPPSTRWSPSRPTEDAPR